MRIEIAHPGEIDVAISSDLRDAYGLQHAVVVDTLEEDGAVLRQQIGKAAASLLSEIVTSTDVLGLGWSRTLIATVAQLTALDAGSVVQLTGALAQSGYDHSSIDLVRDVARVAGCPAYYFYAPMIVPDLAIGGGAVASAGGHAGLRPLPVRDQGRRRYRGMGAARTRPCTTPSRSRSVAHW